MKIKSEKNLRLSTHFLLTQFRSVCVDKFEKGLELGNGNLESRIKRQNLALAAHEFARPKHDAMAPIGTALHQRQNSPAKRSNVKSCPPKSVMHPPQKVSNTVRACRNTHSLVAKARLLAFAHFHVGQRRVPGVAKLEPLLLLHKHHHGAAHDAASPKREKKMKKKYFE